MSYKQKSVLDGQLGMSHDCIISHAEEIDEDIFLYFLIRDKKVVYVGQSKNVRARIESHRHDKDFDRYTLMICPSEYDANDLEAHYILELEPEYNLNLPANNLYFCPEPRINTKGLNTRVMGRIMHQAQMIPVYKSKWGNMYLLPELMQLMYWLHYVNKPMLARPRVLENKFGGVK